MRLLADLKDVFIRPYLHLIRLIGVIVPRRLRTDWRQEWEAELRYREAMLADWDRLGWRNKFDLFWRSTNALWDALWLQQLRWEDEMIQDLRYGLRMLLKHKSFTLLSILTLALGIGANTAILSTVNGFILRPLPVDNPDNLVAPLWGSKQDAEVWGGLSYANYIDLRERNHTLSGLVAWSMASAGLSSGPNSDSIRAEVAWGELVSDNYFDVLGVKMVIGRGFLPEEDSTQNTHPVVVISNSLWRQRFNGDAGIVGKTIYMNGYPFTVVGVTPASFKGLKFGFHQAFWAPLMMSAKLGTPGEWETERGWARFNTLGRLKPGVTTAQAEADLNLIADALAQQYPEKNAETKVQVVSELDGRFYDVTKPFHLASLVGLCVAGLVLLVACANVANLLLARAAAREKEIGIRLALGAGRWRIVRQLLTESAALALFGGVLGWVFAYGGTDLIHSSIPPIPFPFDLDFTPDLYVLKWTIGVSLLTVAIFGLVPALVTSRPDLVKVIKNAAAGETRGNRRLNLRNTLVVAQVTISIFVLICAGLFLRSLNKAMKIDPGFSAENLVTMRLDTNLMAYEEAAGKRFYGEVLRRVSTVPGVRSTSLASFLPMGDSNGDVAPLMKEGEPDPLPNQGIDVSSNWVAPGYFVTLKTPLVMGRDFTERDNKDAPPVAIVNQEFARKFYGSEQNAMGKRFHFWNSKEPLREIVGIAKDGLYLNLYESPRPYIYLPEYQLYQSAMMLMISANTANDMKSVAEAARREIAQVDPGMPVSGITLGDANMSLAYWGPRLSAGVASAFGLFALLLAVTGLYGVMSYSVSQRTREMGIRMALGARVNNVMGLIVSQGMRLVIIGIALGLVSAFALTRLLSSLLLGVSTADPLTFVSMTILLFAVALLASYLPARRATKVDPMVALRYE